MRILSLIIVIVLITGTGWLYRDRVLYPCNTPLAYKIGSIDDRHNINKEDLIVLLKNAETIWEKETETNLFEYDERKGLPINIIFDERQEKQNVITSNQKTLDKAQSDLTREKAKLDSLKNSYDISAITYEKNLSDWNNSERLSRRSFNNLTRERANLERLANNLNSAVNLYNNNVESYNDAVRTFNHHSSFEEEAGVASGNDVINIFLLRGDDSDIYLLAHELGHARGIKEHAITENSIMYYKLQDLTTEPSPEDLDLLGATCNFRI
jgi:metal-responsive CopG/Arc/MetJ family transcriptional regulator